MGRLLASIYDRVMKRAEERSLGSLRERMFAGLSGDVCDLGAGTGANLEHFDPARVRLTLVEPSAPMRERLAKKLADSHFSGRAKVHEANAESLPFDDHSFDAVTTALVLCSVRSPTETLAEIGRVLKPGGSLVVIEHVRHAGASRFLQHALDPLWRACADGCRLIRDTRHTIESAGFEFAEVESATLIPGSPFLRELLVGRAVRRDG